MARPRKSRSVCGLPELDHFGPLNQKAVNPNEVVMTVEEFEAVRLIDNEDMTQEQCAVQMQVSRTTVQAIYNSARKKIAESLVQGKSLSIQGGNYLLCQKRTDDCSGRGCRGHAFAKGSEAKGGEDEAVK